MEKKREKEGEIRKIRIGRLAVDPVFLGLFAFFMLSGLVLFTFIFFSLH